jgi:UDP-glucose 4-epimerase
MKVLVTGGAGFIGSHIVDWLLGLGHDVRVYDNFSTGRRQFLNRSLPSSAVHRADLRQYGRMCLALEDSDLVIHCAGHADVASGWVEPGVDIRNNTIATSDLLRAMWIYKVRRLIFLSTSAVYGESPSPIREDAPFPVQTSLYGASKLACEGMIAAYCAGLGLSATVLRLAPVVGPRYTHGHIYSFVQQLHRDPTTLTVLGNGYQRKSFVDVDDVIRACAIAQSAAIFDLEVGYHVFNVGRADDCCIRDSIGWICDELKVAPVITYGEGERGWVGDHPVLTLDASRLRGIGWLPRISIEEGIRRTVRYLVAHPRLLK